MAAIATTVSTPRPVSCPAEVVGPRQGPEQPAHSLLSPLNPLSPLKPQHLDPRKLPLAHSTSHQLQPADSVPRTRNRHTAKTTKTETAAADEPSDDDDTLYRLSPRADAPLIPSRPLATAVDDNSSSSSSSSSSLSSIPPHTTTTAAAMSPQASGPPPLQIPANAAGPVEDGNLTKFPQHAAVATTSADAQRPVLSRSRTMTTTAEIDSTITKPGSVKINVTGAFIVDPDTATPKNGRGSPTTHHETSDIRLPNHTAVVSHIAVDIGGSLIKLVYFSREVDQTDPGGRLTFQTFETDRIDDCVEFMRDLQDRQLKLTGSRPSDLVVMATGGGAYKFYDKIRDALGVDVSREDEMECLIIGLDFFITEIPREVFTYSETEPMHFVGPREAIYPYLLVNIGSGVSMLKVTGPRTFERVGGTSLGGGTLWGLLSLLTGARTFDDMLEQAGQGDNTNVDMLVGDIYGQDYGKIGLKSTTIASSFGRVFKMKKDAEAAAVAEGKPPGGADMARIGFSDGDISRSLLYAVSNNIGQIALLQSQIHNLSDIYFGGSFIRGHRQTMNTLSYAIKFWSKGTKQAYFLRHEGYLGSVGAFLKRQPKNWGRRGSLENAGLDELHEWRRQRAKEEAAAAAPSS